MKFKMIKTSHVQKSAELFYVHGNKLLYTCISNEFQNVFKRAFFFFFFFLHFHTKQFREVFTVSVHGKFRLLLVCS
jgi:hypothetical protein